MNLWDRLRLVQKDPRTKGPHYRPQPDPPSAETPTAAELIASARKAMEEQQWATAVLHFEEGFEWKKPSGIDLCDYGDCFHNLGNLADAEAAYRRAIRRDPNLARAYNSLGVLLVRDLGDLDQAEDLFQKAMEIDPRGAALDNLRFLQEQRSQGVIMSSDEVRLFPDQETEARAWEEKGRFQKALEIYEEFLEIYPRSVPVLNKTSELHLKLNQPEKAREMLEQALRLKPGFVKAWTNLSAAKMALGDYAGAQEAVEQALKLDPMDRSARWRLSNLTLQTTPPPEVTPPPVEIRASRYEFPVPVFRTEQAPRAGGECSCASCDKKFNLYGQFFMDNPPVVGYVCRECGTFYCDPCVDRTIRVRSVFKCGCGKARIDKSGFAGFEQIEVYRR